MSILLVTNQIKESITPIAPVSLIKNPVFQFIAAKNMASTGIPNSISLFNVVEKEVDFCVSK